MSTFSFWVFNKDLMQAALYMMLFKLCSSQGCLSDPGSLRLVNGYSELEGRVEVCLNGFWASLCTFDQEIASRICIDLGHSKYGAKPTNETLYGSSGIDSTTDVSYFGESYSFTPNHNCRPAGLRCEPHKCEDWDVRLMGGQGMVTEVCLNETWMAISPATHNTSTRVICRQLGYSLYGGQVVRKSLNSSTEVVVVTCSGEETHLSECEDLSRSMSDTAISITCQQKCHLCKGEPAAIQVRIRGTGTLAVSWDFDNVLPLSSILSYEVTCSPAQGSEALISVHSIHNTSNYIELRGLEVAQFNHTCCVTAQQEDFSRHILCTTSSMRTSGVEITVEGIVGITLGSLGVLGVFGTFALLAAVIRYKKKRSVENSPKIKREIICASLDDLFSRSGTAAASTDDITREDAASKIAEPALHEDMVVSECVAYTATAATITPQAYEDVSLILPAETGSPNPPSKECEPLPLPQRNRKDVLKTMHDNV